MTDWSTIYNALHGWVQNSSGIDSVWANQNAPRQQYPFAVLNVLSVEPQGQDSTYTELNVGGSLDVCVVGRRELTLNVQTHSLCQKPDENARFYLERVNMSLRMPSVQQALRAANIGLVRAGALVQLDREIEGVWESRWSQDFTFHAIVSYEPEAGESIEVIEKVEVTDEIPDPDEELLISGV